MTGKIMGIFDSTPATQTSTAPSWQTGYQNYGLNQALSQYQNTQNLVAPFAPQQEQAISNITNLANRGDPGTNAAGEFHHQHAERQRSAEPAVECAVQSGREPDPEPVGESVCGGWPKRRSVPRGQCTGVGDLGANLYGNAFGQEAGLQQAALGAAPGNLQSQLGLQSSLYGAGQNVQNQSQQYINAPQNFLNQYLSEVNGALGQTTSGTPAFNAGAGALGGGIVGSGLGGAIGNALGGSSGSGWGQLAGGLLGAYAGGN
jgi:hypothetical protein